MINLFQPRIIYLLLVHSFSLNGLVPTNAIVVIDTVRGACSIVQPYLLWHRLCKYSNGWLLGCCSVPLTVQFTVSAQKGGRGRLPLPFAQSSLSKLQLSFNQKVHDYASFICNTYGFCSASHISAMHKLFLTPASAQRGGVSNNIMPCVLANEFKPKLQSHRSTEAPLV